MEQIQAEARLDENNLKFRYILRAIEEHLSEPFIEWTPKGLKIYGADTAMVALYNVRFKPEMFDKYDAPAQKDLEGKEPESIISGANIEPIKKLLEKVTKSDTYTLAYGDRVTDQYTWRKDLEDDAEFSKNKGWELQVSTEEGLNVNSGWKELNLNEDEIPGFEKLDFKNTVQVSTHDLKKMVDFMVGVDAFYLKAENTGLRVGATFSNNEFDDTREFELNKEMEDVELDEWQEDSQSMFSKDYIDGLFSGKIEKVTDTVKISTGDDFPMKISFENDLVDFEFILAPRVEED